MTVLRIVAALLLPPLGIFLTRGLGTPFWIGVLLTLLGYVPGVVYALYIVVTSGEGRAAAA